MLCEKSFQMQACQTDLRHVYKVGFQGLGVWAVLEVNPGPLVWLSKALYNGAVSSTLFKHLGPGLQFTWTQDSGFSPQLLDMNWACLVAVGVAGSEGHLFYMTSLSSPGSCGTCPFKKKKKALKINILTDEILKGKEDPLSHSHNSEGDS